MKIGYRIGLLTGALLVLMAVIAAYALSSLGKIRASSNRVSMVYIPMQEVVDELAIHQLEESVSVEKALRMASTPGIDLNDNEDYTNLVEAFEKSKSDLAAHAAESTPLDEQINDATLSRKLNQLLDHQKTFEDDFAELQKLLKSGNLEKALLGAESLEATANLVHEEVTAIQTLVDKKVADASSANEALEDETIRGLLIMVGLALLVGIVASIWIVRGITRPLAEVVNASQQVARGELSVSLSCEGRTDELGELARSFQQMMRSLQEAAAVAESISEGDLSISFSPHSAQDQLGQSLAKMLANLQAVGELAIRIGKGDLTAQITPKSSRDQLGTALKVMVSNLSEALGEVQEAVNGLATAATQITSTTSEFASSASETASSIAETTATVAEVRQAADMMSEKAREVSRNAGQVETVSRNGMQAVESTSKAIARIEQQMREIAESIIALSDRSQAIAEIIGSVEDLAEQSNLLAVNASIEASKAGEHGKGFAVVAQEIRNLANESKRSTTQVRGILSDIQKATSKAVMVTEQGSKVVEQGVQHAHAASDAMASLSGVIEEAADSAIHIAASSQEQAVGMEQVTSAMGDIKQAGDQNAEGSRLLEDAGRNLQNLGSRLQDLVRKYKIN